MKHEVPLAKVLMYSTFDPRSQGSCCSNVLLVLLQEQPQKVLVSLLTARSTEQAQLGLWKESKMKPEVRLPRIGAVADRVLVTNCSLLLRDPDDSFV